MLGINRHERAVCVHELRRTHKLRERKTKKAAAEVPSSTGTTANVCVQKKRVCEQEKTNPKRRIETNEKRNQFFTIMHRTQPTQPLNGKYTVFYAMDISIHFDIIHIGHPIKAVEDNRKRKNSIPN